jgi:hypothetical protein
MFSFIKKILWVETTKNRLYKEIVVFGLRFRVENFSIKLRELLRRPFLNFKFRRFVQTPRVIVSLTSFPERIDEVHLCIYSLLNQTRKPKMVVLWLAREEFPGGEAGLPSDLLALRSHGLSIRWCGNIGSYKKLIPSLLEFPRDILVTADDDLYYEKTWLERLLDSYAAHPEDINAHRAHGVRFDAFGNVRPYAEWEYERKAPEYEAARVLNFATTGGGVLYPPGCFHPDVLDADLALSLCPTGDDIWFWAMGVLGGMKFRIIKGGTQQVRYISLKKQLHAPTLSSINCGRNRNDEQLAAVLVHYPELLDILHSGGGAKKPKKILVPVRSRAAAPEQVFS